MFKPVSKAGSAFVSLNGGSAFGENIGGPPQFFLGGRGGFSAYGTNELLTNQYFDARCGYLQDLRTLPPFLGNKIFALVYYEIGKVYGLPNVSRLPESLSAGVVVETALGPIFIGGAAGDSGHRKFFFQLGKIF